MKANIHPTYYDDTKITCACGNVVLAGSTLKEQKTEICSNCHPFYTGKQKLVDTAGRVDKFRAKMKAAEKHKTGGKLEKKEEQKKEKGGEKYLTLDQIKKIKEKSTKKKAKKKVEEKAEEKLEVKTEEKAEEITEEKLEVKTEEKAEAKAKEKLKVKKSK